MNAPVTEAPRGPLPQALQDWLEQTLGDLFAYAHLPEYEIVALAQEQEMHHELEWYYSMKARDVGGWENKRSRVRELQRRLSPDARRERREFWQNVL